ncbi:MAG: ankyrin repeat domain-containing protein [Leptospira sp.]|nr:ankyrin repeat domain-containing protein [Leptospira sp.]NCS92355.1 ankyrin repeat domain-containing protein [Leptospira sp.]
MIHKILFLVLLSQVSCSSLPYTIEDNNFEKAKKMIADGAEVNETSDCFHALTIASENNDLELVSMLLEKNANVNNRSEECGYSERVGPMKFRYKYGSRTALDNVANAEIAKMLIAKGANPNIAGYKQYTFTTDHDLALWNAIRNEDLDLVKVLVEAGANVNVYSKDGKNLILNIAEAKKKNHPKILAYLKTKGIKELSLSSAKAIATEGKILTTYKHIATGAVTEMDRNIAEAVYNNPKNFSWLTLNAADGKYYHYSEFVWTETGQNMFEWYLLRKKMKGDIK